MATEDKSKNSDLPPLRARQNIGPKTKKPPMAERVKGTVHRFYKGGLRNRDQLRNMGLL